MKYLVAILLFGFCPAILANWDDTPPETKSTTKYNPYDQKWSYEDTDTKLKYNPYDQQWTYEKPQTKLQWNAYEQKWEYTK